MLDIKNDIKDDGLLVRDINNNGQIDDGEILTLDQANNDNTKQPATVDCVYCFNIVA